MIIMNYLTNSPYFFCVLAMTHKVTNTGDDVLDDFRMSLEYWTSD